MRGAEGGAAGLAGPTPGAGKPVDNAVNRYLIDGVLPAGDTTCPSTPFRRSHV